MCELHLLVVRHEGYLVLGEVHVVVDSAALHCNEQFTNEGLWDYTEDNLSLQLETSSKYLFETMALPRGLQTGLDVAGCQIVFRFIFVVIIFIALPPPMSTTTEILYDYCVSLIFMRFPLRKIKSSLSLPGSMLR